MSMEELNIEATIRNCTFFKGLSETSCQQVASVTSARQSEKRDILFREGTDGNAIYVLANGSVQLAKTTANGNDIVIKTVKPGEVFAEVILFEQRHYPVTATAIADSLVLVISRDDMLHLMDNETFRNEFMKMLMEKMRYLTKRIEQLNNQSVEDRLLHFLKEQYGDHEIIHTPLSKKDIAAAIGTTPETLSRTIQKLQSENMLKWQGKTIQRLKEF